jgi:group I intron endonuclease
MLGYKHSPEAIQKMLNRFKIYKHPMLGKHHTITTKEKISLATRNSKNPMFGKKHTDKGKNLISKALSKPVYIYKIVDNQLELKEIFSSSVKLVELLNLHKSTIGKYIKKGKIIK